MQFNELVLGIVGISASASVVKSYIAYRLKVLEARVQKAAEPHRAMHSELNELKKSVESLRDVTTQYDMSFDTALHRIESRVGNLEQRVTAVEGSPNTVNAGR